MKREINGERGIGFLGGIGFLREKGLLEKGREVFFS
jgi:hypothetical protein